MQRLNSAEARERWLNELPIAALQLHAQECGIDVSSCIEKRDLVQRILESEPHEFSSGDADVQPVRDRQLSQVQADLQADEDLARRLQAEEEAQVRMVSSPGSRTGSSTPTGHRGAGNANSAARAQSLLSFISQALNQPGQAGRPPGQTRRGEDGFGALPAISPAASPSGSPDRPVRPPPSFGSPGASGSSLPPGAGGPRSEDRERAVAELLSGLAARRDARPKARASPGGQGQGAVGDAEPPDVDVAAQALIGLLSQVLGNGDGRDPSGENIAGMTALTELLGNLMPNQGIESAVVDSRTATMTYSPEADRGQARVDGEENKCMVCLEEFKAADELRILPCLHRYHRDCIDPWLALNRHCPVCKHDVTS